MKESDNFVLVSYFNIYENVDDLALGISSHI